MPSPSYFLPLPPLSPHPSCVSCCVGIRKADRRPIHYLNTPLPQPPPLPFLPSSLPPCLRTIIAWSIFLVSMMWLTTTIQLVLGIDIVWLRPREIPMGMHAAALALIFALPSIRNSQVIR